MACAWIAGTTVVGLVVVIIGGANLLTPPDVFGAGVPRSMRVPVLTSTAVTTIGLGLIVGALWFSLRDWRWGRPVASLVGVLGITFIVFTAWANCLIPHEYCSSMQ